MNKALLKWNVLCAIGLFILALTAVFYFLKFYIWVIGGLVVGLLLTSASWKRMDLLKRAGAALKNGKAEIIVYYLGRNLKERQSTVIPAGADTFYFYGFSPEKNDIKMFRWERIQRAIENGIEYKKEDIMERLRG